MAEPSPQDDIMPLPKLKQALALAVGKPLGCAFGLSKDKKDVVLLIEKTAKPEKAAEALRRDGKAVLDMTSLRFGEVNIDAAGDPGTVKFKVNRSEAGGTATAMVRLIKKAGYQGVAFSVDAGLNPADAADAPPPDAPPPDSTAPAAAPPPPPPPPKVAPPPPPGPPPAAPSAPDPAAMAKTLAALVQRIPAAIAADPAAKDNLLQMAKMANVNLKTNNLKTAADLMAKLRAIVGDPPKAPPPPPPAAKSPSDAAALAKTLAGLAQRVADVTDAEASDRDQLLTLAKQANLNLKTGNMKAAGDLVRQLADGLDALEATPLPTPDSAALRALDDLRDRLKEMQGQAFLLPEPGKSALLARAKLAVAALADAGVRKMTIVVDALETDLHRAIALARVGDLFAAEVAAGADEMLARLQDLQRQAFLLPEPAKSTLTARARRTLGRLAASADPATVADQVEAIAAAVAQAASTARRDAATAQARGGGAGAEAP